MEIFLDKDFSGRTCFHLITENEYQKLFEGDLISQLLEQLWQGKLTYDCDGRATNYSKLRVMSTAAVKKLTGEVISMDDIK